jgi:hypothetical protein
VEQEAQTYPRLKDQKDQGDWPECPYILPLGAKSAITTGEPPTSMAQIDIFCHNALS